MNPYPMNMPPPTGGAAKLGKNDRWIVNFLTFAAIVYSAGYLLNYLQNSSLGEQGGSLLLMLVLVLKAMSVPGSRSINGRGTVLMAALFVLALFNMVISWDVASTGPRWIVWLIMVISFGRITGACDGTWLEAAIRRLPYLFILIYFSILSSYHFQPDEESLAGARHLSGLYGNLILAAGLFAATSRQRLIFVLFGLVGIYNSGAGGALFTIPIMFVPYILYSTTSAPIKGMAVAALLMFGLAFFFESQLFSSFLDIKVDQKTDGEFAYNGLDRLNRSKDERLALIQFGVNLSLANPMGTGLGPTYADEVNAVFHVGHVHNGTISMLIELGIPGFTVLASLFLWMFWSIIRSRFIPQQIKAFYFTYFFTVFGRSLSENYTPFDLGNLFNIVFLVFSAALFLHQSMRAPARVPARMPPPFPVRPRWSNAYGPGRTSV